MKEEKLATEAMDELYGLEDLKGALRKWYMRGTIDGMDNMMLMSIGKRPNIPNVDEIEAEMTNDLLRARR